MIRPVIKMRWKKLDTEAILGTLATEIAAELNELKVPIKAVVARNIGTQYFTLRDLRMLQHPYRVGGPGRPGGLPAGVVNRQSGEFYRSIRVRGPLISKNRVLITLYSSGDKEKGGWLLEGTKRMKGRPWTVHLEKEVDKVIMPVLDRLTYLNKRLKVKV